MITIKFDRNILHISYYGEIISLSLDDVISIKKQELYNSPFNIPTLDWDGLCKTIPIPSKIILELSNKNQILLECGFIDNDKINIWEGELDKAYHQILNKWIEIKRKKNG